MCGAGPWHRRSWAENRMYNRWTNSNVFFDGIPFQFWNLEMIGSMVVITPIMWLTPHWYPQHVQSWDVNGVNCGDLSITKKSGIVLGFGEFTKPGFLHHVCKAWFSTWKIKAEILRTRISAKQLTFLMVGSANGIYNIYIYNNSKWFQFPCWKESIGYTQPTRFATFLGDFGGL